MSRALSPALTLLGGVFALALGLLPVDAAAAAPGSRAEQASGADARPLAGGPRAGGAKGKGKGKGKSGPGAPGAGRRASAQGKGEAEGSAVGPLAAGGRGAGGARPRGEASDPDRAAAPKPGGPKGGAAAKPRAGGPLVAGTGPRGNGKPRASEAAPARPRPSLEGPRAQPAPKRPPTAGPLPRTAHPPAAPPPEENCLPKADPKSQVDRAGTLAVGLRGGALGSTADAGGAFVDPGLGLAVRVRPLNMFGLEGSYLHHGGGLGGADLGLPDQLRTHESFSASAQLFFAPRQLVSPYLSLGGTWQAQQVEAQSGALVAAAPTQEDRRRGLHGGLGVELNVGQHVGLGVELRYLHDRDHAAGDPLGQGQLQALGGLNLYF